MKRVIKKTVIITDDRRLEEFNYFSSLVGGGKNGHF
jgi:hypothetical protein